MVDGDKSLSDYLFVREIFGSDHCPVELVLGAE